MYQVNKINRTSDFFVQKNRKIDRKSNKIGPHATGTFLLVFPTQ